MAPDLEADGEMQGDTAISEVLRSRVMPNSTLTGSANLLVFPNLDAANITLGVVRSMTDALHVGPILLGSRKPAHILLPSVTSRGVVNMATLAVVEASYPAEVQPVGMPFEQNFKTSGQHRTPATTPAALR